MFNKENRLRIKIYNISVGSIFYISDIIDGENRGFYSFGIIKVLLDIEDKDYKFICDNIVKTSDIFFKNVYNNKNNKNKSINIDNYSSVFDLKLDDKNYKLVSNKNNINEIFIVQNINNEYLIETGKENLRYIINNMARTLSIILE